MKVTRAEDTAGEYFTHHVGDFRVVLTPMIYGFRIRVGQIGDTTTYNLDYCAGAAETAVTLIYNLVIRALEAGNHPTYFPHFVRKPILLDTRCIIELSKLADESTSTEEFSINDIQLRMYREEYMRYVSTL